MNIRQHVQDLKHTLPAIFIALKDKDTPIIAKIFAGMTITYALSPLDLIPDFIPVLGYLDDIIILPILIFLTKKFIPYDIWIQSKEKSIGMWNDGKPKKWYYVIPIVGIWLLVIGLVIKFIWL